MSLTKPRVRLWHLAPSSLRSEVDDQETAFREHRQLKEARQRIAVLERSLATVHGLLYDLVTKRLYDEHRVSPAWLAAAQEICPPRR